MSQQRQFLRVQNSDDSIEYWEGSTKIAFINEHGTLQATRGNADSKVDLTGWVLTKYPNDFPADPVEVENQEVSDNSSETESAPENEPEAGAVPDHGEDENPFPKELIPGTDVGVDPNAISLVLPIICPIVGASHLGDKDPAVVNWWRQNHPEEFKKRYHGRRIQSESGIIV